MGKITYFPKQCDTTSNEVDVIQISNNKIKINDVECEPMDLEKFIEQYPISEEAEERFIRGLFQIIKEELVDNWKVMKIFKEIFRK